VDGQLTFRTKTRAIRDSEKLAQKTDGSQVFAKGFVWEVEEVVIGKMIQMNATSVDFALEFPGSDCSLSGSCVFVNQFVILPCLLQGSVANWFTYRV
jgi:hypothetical protein